MITDLIVRTASVARISFLVAPLKFILRRWKILLPATLVFGVLVPLLCDHHVGSASIGRCDTEISKVKTHSVALLLGTAREFNGRRNVFYTKRIEAAAALFHAGKIRAILASGDNRHESYDEPSNMKSDLVAAGVPAEFITLDYAGFRTRDSIIRAKLVFGQDELIVVSQRFHAERALYIARSQGIDARAYIAADPTSIFSNRKVRLRETFARALAVADEAVNRQPKFLGKKETVNLASLSR